MDQGRQVSAPAARCGWGARLRPQHLLAALFLREWSIPEASLLLMTSFFASAVLGAVRQVLFNAQFGVSWEANAYYAAFRLPDTLFSLIAGGALASAMVPVLASAFCEGGEQAAWRLTSLVLTALLAALALVVLLSEALTPPFVRTLLAPGFDLATSRLTATLTRIMLAQVLILGVGSVATAVLTSRSQFVPAALSAASHNLALIAGILAARFVPGLGIYGPTLGVVAGALLQVAILLPGLWACGFHYRPAWDLRDPRLRQVVQLLVPNGLSVAVGYAGFILDTSFASQAHEAAALPAIHNAFLLAQLPVTLLGQAVGQSAFPRLAVRAAAQEWPQLWRTLWRTLGAVLLLALPAILGLTLLGRLLIHLLFEHGQFGPEAGALTYAALVPYALGLPGAIGTEVLIRGLIALRDTRTPLFTNTLQVAGRGALMALLLPRLGTLAIPIAFAALTSLEALALATVLAVKLSRRLRTVPPSAHRPTRATP